MRAASASSSGTNPNPNPNPKPNPNPNPNPNPHPGKCKQLQRACELLDLMQREGVLPNAHTFTTIINACTQAQDLERGLQVLARVVQCSSPLPSP